MHQQNFNDNIPATSEPTPPPTLIYEDQESIVESTPEQALYGSSVDIELQDFVGSSKFVKKSFRVVK